MFLLLEIMAEIRTSQSSAHDEYDVIVNGTKTPQLATHALTHLNRVATTSCSSYRRRIIVCYLLYASWRERERERV